MNQFNEAGGCYVLMTFPVKCRVTCPGFNPALLPGTMYLAGETWPFLVHANIVLLCMHTRVFAAFCIYLFVFYFLLTYVYIYLFILFTIH